MKRFVIFVLFLLAACAPSAAQNHPAVSGLVTPSGVSGLPTLTPSLPQAPSFMLALTPTPRPSSTPFETPSPQPTPPGGYKIGSTQTSPRDGMLLVYVPEGNFKMGTSPEQYDQAVQICLNAGEQRAYCESATKNEEPLHTVWLDAYWIDRTDVTNARFQRFIADSGYQTDAEKRGKSFAFNATSKNWEIINGATWNHPQGPDSSLDGLENHPVVQVSWNDAVAYCAWAGRRLPTEAEWEKAARGTDGRIYPWGNQKPAGNLLNFADKNFDFGWSDKSINDGYRFTSPVGNYPDGASPYGALDMAGNVLQWVADFSQWDYYASSPERNPTGPLTGTYRIIRGGDFAGSGYYARSAFRLDYIPTVTQVIGGFRCAVSP